MLYSGGSRWVEHRYIYHMTWPNRIFEAIEWVNIIWLIISYDASWKNKALFALQKVKGQWYVTTWGTNQYLQHGWLLRVKIPVGKMKFPTWRGQVESSKRLSKTLTLGDNVWLSMEGSNSHFKSIPNIYEKEGPEYRASIKPASPIFHSLFMFLRSVNKKCVFRFKMPPPLHSGGRVK